MTVAHVYTVAFEGIEAREVDVQVHIAEGGSGQFTIVGLADKAVGESRERVRSALAAVGLALPYKRITVNLAPADLPKEGSHYDLPVALALLAAMGVLPASEMSGYTAMGELSLDGQITAVAGVLPAAIAAVEAQRGLICPAACGSEAAWAGELEIIAAPSLIALVNHIKGAQVLAVPQARLAESAVSIPDLKDVKGQETAKRALEIAAAGGLGFIHPGDMLAQGRRRSIRMGVEILGPKPTFPLGGMNVTDIPDRRRDNDLRKTIADYRKMAAQTARDAASSQDPATRERYLALAKSLTELADTLQGRPSKNPTDD